MKLNCQSQINWSQMSYKWWAFSCCRIYPLFSRTQKDKYWVFRIFHQLQHLRLHIYIYCNTHKKTKKREGKHSINHKKKENIRMWITEEDYSRKPHLTISLSSNSRRASRWWILVMGDTEKFVKTGLKNRQEKNKRWTVVWFFCNYK